MVFRLRLFLAFAGLAGAWYMEVRGEPGQALPSMATGANYWQNKKDSLVIFPSYIYKTGSRYNVNIHGWVFQKEKNSTWRRAMLKQISRRLGANASLSKEAKRTLEERLRWLLCPKPRFACLRGPT